MSRTILVSLPVKDLPASVAFYEAIGFTINPRFTGDSAAFMVWSNTITVVLLTHAKWSELSTRALPPAGTCGVGFQLSVADRDAVDAMNAKAGAHGGMSDVNAVEDMGFMYTRDFADPGGQVWGATWMDPAALPAED